MSFLQLDNKTVLVTGVANKRSVATHVTRVLIEAGATVVLVVQGDAQAEAASALFPDLLCLRCDVAHPEQIERLAAELATREIALHGFVHSLAFADYSDGARPFHEVSQAAFTEAMQVSCYSLVTLANALRPRLADDASVVTISVSTTTMASESYGYMAPIKAALDSAVVFLAKSFSGLEAPRRVRFNAVGPGLLKTSASAGIPDYLKSYLFAEQCTLRGEGVRTEEVANAVAFLLSPRSSGINAQKLVIDAGMYANYFNAEVVDKATRVER